MNTRTFQNKETLKKQFDAVDVINKTYADASEYDLNDALIFLTKAISSTKIKNKQLVKQHFGKFVQCRVVLEEIWANIKQKGYDKEFTSELEQNIKIVEKKFREATSAILEDSKDEANRERREYYMRRYVELFNIKPELKKNLNNLERFADLYRKAKDLYEGLKGSTYVQRIWSSIHDERCEFLETVYKNIQRPGNSFDEALYYFNLYFRVCEHKTEYKIMNTLLVNFKENTTRDLEMRSLDREEYLEEATKHYMKLVKKVDDRIQIEGTNHYFHCVERVFDDSEIFFVKVWTKKLIGNIRMVELSTDAKRVYILHLKKLKLKSIDDEFPNTPSALTTEEFLRIISRIKHVFGFFVDVVSKEEEKYLRNKVLEGVRKCYKSLELKSYSDLEVVTKDVYELRQLLGSSRSVAVKELCGIINSYIENHIAKIADKISKTVERKNSDVSLLIEIVRIIEEIPVEYVRVAKRIKPLICKHPTALYYLSGILGMDPPELSNTQRLRVEEIRYQFGFLLHNH